MVLSNFHSVTRIGFIRYNLCCKDLVELLKSIGPYEDIEDIEVLDISENNFENKFLFVNALKSTILGRKMLKTLIIADNGFDLTIVPLLKDALGFYIGEIIL